MAEPGEASFQPEKEKTEEERGYNFEKIEEFEESMISLVDKIKDKIESGEYGALLSDDAGGRIPTLILKEIIKQKGPKEKPDKRVSRVKILFLASGQFYLPKKEDLEKNETEKRNYEEMTKYLKKLDIPKDKKTLIITQIVERAHTLQRIGVALNDIGISDFDFAVLDKYPMHTEDELKNTFKKMFNSEIFFGGENYESDLSEYHEDFSGISKHKEYSPYPKKIGEQEHINKARRDIKLIAKRVIEQVWEKK